jgi:hypothetical protein
MINRLWFFSKIIWWTCTAAADLWRIKSLRKYFSGVIQKLPSVFARSACVKRGFVCSFALLTFFICISGFIRWGQDIRFGMVFLRMLWFMHKGKNVLIMMLRMEVCMAQEYCFITFSFAFFVVLIIYCVLLFFQSLVGPPFHPWLTYLHREMRKVAFFFFFVCLSFWLFVLHWFRPPFLFFLLYACVNECIHVR